MCRFEPLRDGLHHRMLAATLRIGFELRFQIADIERGKARGSRPVSGAIESVAGKAGVRRSRMAAAQGDQFPARREAVGRSGVHGAARCDER
jgi:hypothetical protein